MSFPFVPIDQFTPSTPAWSTIGKIDSWSANTNKTRYTFVFGQRSLYIEILGPQSFRLRFNPAENAQYNYETSTAVINRDLGISELTITDSQPADDQLVISTGTIDIHVDLSSFEVSVYKGSQLIHRDAPGEGILYIPGQEVTAIMKSTGPGSKYLGLGEKAGAELFKNNFAYTFFNFDCFSYGGPALGEPGPLNPTEPLYCSIPFLVESNPQPPGPFAGSAYATGVFLDNPSQSYANIAANIYNDMTGKYYLGSLYNELDYYFFAGDQVTDILSQYTTLTGRSQMPPKYIFGYQQGAYGYFDRYKLSIAANSFRAARIPCDGLHIDVDFQDNYRTFTHSEIKFPNVKSYFEELHSIGFKMCTNITPVITDNPLDQSGQKAPYEQRDNLFAADCMIYNTRYEGGESADVYPGGVNYGFNRGNNPYPSPPLLPNRQGLVPLAAPGNYPDFGLQKARETWGEQYDHLINEVGMDFIWQDMTCPAINANLSPANVYMKTFPQDLMIAQEQTMEDGSVEVVYHPNAKVHNSYVNNLLDGTWNGINKLAPQRRNFIIARGGYAGMQRYAGLWTGDSASTWDFLKINLPEVLNLGLSGVPISGCDIGGFAVGYGPSSGTTSQSYVDDGEIFGGITNYELLTRWMQLGSFLPWYRNHYDGYNKQFQEPYAYQEPVPSNCRKYVELRYRMMQVYYDAMYNWTQTGNPICRPLFLNDSNDLASYDHANDQFFVGGDFLVAPIITQHETANPPTPPTRSVYLPAGSNWYAFMDNAKPLAGSVQGGTLINDYYADLSQVPCYVRAGAILPFGEVEQFVGQLKDNPITLNCYPGPDRWTDDQAYSMYQDDGISPDEEGTNFRLTKVYQQTITDSSTVTRNIRIAKQTDNYQPGANYHYIALLGSVSAASQVTQDGANLPNVGGANNLQASDSPCWYYNESIDIVFVKVYDDKSDTTISVKY
ncbi:TIM-barrel domain-containing protein [Persicirhabdus sediminis]|uniref:DUF4968 domain-containing protein n=1 Tax=Persicirhabdus sediminis TaxID=454144 RepID=A0A8J7SI28_9BACT|nr:TIM-barrel domain-containing protein [Persicirhabdus sediminis]MBK1790166.1 DUF4968 domain-containing protein [Persicirhabdus sediminis]